VGMSGLQMGPSKAYRWHDSAIGYLLSGAAEQPPEQRMHDVRALARAQPGVVLHELPVSEDLPLPSVTALQRRGVAPPLASFSAYTAKFDRNWSVSSYSALVRDATWATSSTGNVPDVLRVDEPDQADAVIGPQRPGQQPWHRFPRGALAGNFLHDQLEWLAGEGFALDDSAELQERLARRCERQGWGHRADDVVAWLRRVCATPLPVPGSPLSRLGTVVAEMEFWLPSDGLRAEHVDALCVRHIQPGRPRPRLPERALKGLLMGFADLVFEHEGRYWVLDYKSNALGPRDGDYTAPAMDAAMLEHRYDVQATLYLLALHRLLRSRLGTAYSPARHLGGAIYFFLRGVNSATAGCCAVAAPLALIAELDAVLPRGDFAPGQEAA
jgi:exodeoxyribonuclease V beta subunit